MTTGSAAGGATRSSTVVQIAAPRDVSPPASDSILPVCLDEQPQRPFDHGSREAPDHFTRWRWNVIRSVLAGGAAPTCRSIVVIWPRW